MDKVMFLWGAVFFCAVWVVGSIRQCGELFGWWSEPSVTLVGVNAYAAFTGMMVIGVGMKVFSNKD